MHALRIINKDGQAPTAEEITAANKVATTFKSATIGTFKVTDPIDDIEVEYHAHKALAFTQGGSSIYFGFGAQVEMRCWCRGVVLAETKAAAQPTVTYETAYVSPGTGSVTATLYDSVGGIAGTVTGTRTLIPGYYAYDNIFIDVVASNVQAYTPLPDRWQIHTGSGTGVFTGIGSWIPVSPSYESLLAAAQAAANQRSAVFLTDGTELASANRTDSGDGKIKYNVIPYKIWLGGGMAQLYTEYSPDGNNAIAPQLSGNLTFTIPDDVCYGKASGVLLAIQSDDYQFINSLGRESLVKEIKFLPVDMTVGEIYEYKGFKYNWGIFSNFIIYGNMTEYEQSITNNFIDNYLLPASVEALTREHARRKKCSDGQLAYLRNGFLSPEFEYFIKTQHPVSALVRRDIPMQVVSRDQELVSDVTDDNDNRTRVWSASVTVKYNFVDDDGNVDPKEHTFTGTIQQVDTTHKARNDEPIAEVSSSKFTYTNFPMLADSSTGEAYTLPSPLPALPYSASLTLKTNNAIWHDDKSYPLLVEANGTFNKSPWVEDDTYSYPSYPYDSTTLVPPVEKTSDYITFAHPQFLLDYIRDSKPVEKTTDSNGNKAPVTPSTDWLSSRLTDKEVIKVIPLNHVGNSYGNYGMFPLMQRDAEDNLIVNELRIYGYAEFQYSAETTSFTFKKWVELIDGGKLTILADDEVSLDDDLNPTTISVTSNGETKTYNLAPKSFEYYEEWGATNCVCIGNKAIWSDVKADAKEQKKNISNNTPEGHELTAEEKLYKAVREAIA